jgi:hypothetical protein
MENLKNDVRSKALLLIFFLVTSVVSIALKFLKALFSYDLYCLSDKTPPLTNRDSRYATAVF